MYYIFSCKCHVNLLKQKAVFFNIITADTCITRMLRLLIFIFERKLNVGRSASAYECSKFWKHTEFKRCPNQILSGRSSATVSSTNDNDFPSQIRRSE